MGSWERGALCGFQSRQYCPSVHLGPGRRGRDIQAGHLRGEGLAGSEVRSQGSGVGRPRSARFRKHLTLPPAGRVL